MKPNKKKQPFKVNLEEHTEEELKALEEEKELRCKVNLQRGQLEKALWRGMIEHPLIIEYPPQSGRVELFLERKDDKGVLLDLNLVNDAVKSLSFDVKIAEDDECYHIYKIGVTK